MASPPCLPRDARLGQSQSLREPVALSDLWEEDVTVPLRDIKAGATNPVPELGRHWDSTVCPGKHGDPSEAFSNEVTHKSTETKGGEFWRVG